jgi:hypothetical protein
VLPPDQIPLEPELNAQSAPLETFNPAFDSTLSQTAAEPPAANRSTDSPFLPSESDISAAAHRLERVQMDKVHPNETQSSRVVTEEPALRRDLPKFAIPGDEMGVLNVLERRWGDLKVQPVNNRPRQLPLPITADDRSSILMPKQQIFDGLYNSNLAFATSKTHPENNAGDTHHLNAATTQFKPTHSEIKIGNYRMDGNEGEDHSSTASVSSAPLSASIGGTSSLKDRAALLTPEESDKLTPAVLGNKISQALDAFDSIQESRIRLEDLEKSRQLMIAQQETVAYVVNFPHSIKMQLE